MNANKKAVSRIKDILAYVDGEAAVDDRADSHAQRPRFDLKTIARLSDSDPAAISKSTEPEVAPAWEHAFLAEFRVTANMAIACEAASVERAVVVERMYKSESFRVKLALAEDEAIDRLEAVAWRRAVEKSDRLMTYLLENKRPEVYGKNARPDDGMNAASASVSSEEN